MATVAEIIHDLEYQRERLRAYKQAALEENRPTDARHYRDAIGALSHAITALDRIVHDDPQ